MVRFEYIEAQSLGEATAFLEEHGAQAAALAGGTDLLLRLKRRLFRPRYVVNIKAIPGLNHLASQDGQGLRLGALTTIRTLETSPLVRGQYSMLAQAAGTVGSVQVRNLATVGGNLCNAAPSADTAPALIALGATATMVGPRGERSLPLADFFTGPGTTALGNGELLTELQLPPPPPHSAGVYLKLSPRRAMDIAVVGVAARVALEGRQGPCRDCRIVLGAVAPTPLRALEAEAILRGREITPELAQRAAQETAAASRPITDVRGSAEYRREMVAVLTRRAIMAALEQAQA